MSMTNHQGSNEHLLKVKKEVQKRAWTKDEELVLLAGLKYLVAKGWKSDNGFRYNYMVKLEHIMRAKWPSTDLKAKPHIDSKISAWKRTYAKLCDILGRSGVGFNVHGDNKIDCEQAVWDEICKANDKIRYWKKKRWDYYEDWTIVFGKDRATGTGALEFEEMLEEYNNEENIVNEERVNANTPMVDLDDDNADETMAAEDSVAQSSFVTTPKSRGKNKRRFEETMSSLVDIVEEMEKTNKAKLEATKEGFATVNKNKQLRDEVWPVLENLQGLTLEDQFDAIELLYQSPVSLEIFMKLSDAARPAYVRRLIRLSST